MQELAMYLARRSGMQRLIQIGAKSAGCFEIPDSPFTEHICIDLPEMKNFVQKNVPSSTFIACDFDRALTEQIHADVFSNSVVMCSGILEILVDPQRLAREFASLRTRCPWLLLATPDLARVRGLPDPGPPTMGWTADGFGRLLVDCGFPRNLLIGYTINSLEGRAKDTVLVVAGNQAEHLESSRRLKIAAIINMFNEADIIEPVVRHLVNQGIDVHLVDNWSNDGTYEIGRDLVAQGICAKVLRFPDQPSGDYEWARQLDHTAQYAASLEVDWVMHHDADEIRLSPWPNVPLARAIEYVDGLGYTALDFTVINFFFTDDEEKSKFVPEQFKWFDWGRQPSDFVQVKAWKNVTRVNLTTSGGHEAEFDGRRVYPIKFLTKHYPLRSQRQANQKILRDRLPRIEKEQRERGWHIQYDAFRMVQTVRHWRQLELRNFDLNIFNAEYLVERISGIGVETEPNVIPSFGTVLSEMERWGREAQASRTKLTEMEATISAESAKIARLSAERSDARDRAAGLDAQLSDARDRAAGLDAQLSDARDRAAGLDAQLSDARDRAAGLDAQLSDARDRAAGLDAQLSDARHRIVELRSALEAEEKQLQSIRMSSSWRLTLPLRRFAEEFPRLAGQLKRLVELGSRGGHRIRRMLNARLLASSQFFDRDWYLGQYPDVGVAGVDPVLHYLEHGGPEGRNPSPLFDSEWYQQQNPDVRTASINPLVHYLRHGAAEGRHPSPSSTNDLGILSAQRPIAPHSACERNPLVSVLIVNYDGIRHLSDCFGSLRCLNYKNYEIIFVDNASSDASVDFVRLQYPEAKVIILDHNVGFAEANNIGFELSRGEYIFVLNNDTRCDRECLDHLVAVLDSDPGLGAVGPKIRFWTKFAIVKIEMGGRETILIDITELGKALPEYNKVLFHRGCSEPFVYQGKVVRRFQGKSQFAVPADSLCSGMDLHIYMEGAAKINVEIGNETFAHILTPSAWQVIRLASHQSASEARWIVNNAGSHLRNDGVVIDRGFGHPDDGAFDVADEPAALCGCAMLIRRSVLFENEPLFAAEFFAYFEDTDLSLRIRRKGYRIAYCPQSVVYHRHASTSAEESSFFRYYVNRNRILFYALHFPESFWRPRLAKAKSELTHLRKFYGSPSCTQEERDFGQKIENIFADWDYLLPQITKGQFYDRKAHFPRFAVYNSYWNTMGGGEHHATVLAESLQTRGPVDLICERDFSLEELARSFDVNLSGCRKVVVSALELHNRKHMTGRYDVFVNCTYGSDLTSHAKQSMYVVSFPFSLKGRPINSDLFLRSYRHYFANSDYTRRWCQRFWNVDAEILYPSANTAHCVSDKGAVGEKRPVILNVGRFFRHGHCKKQLELVQVFKELVEQQVLGPEWKLVLAGQRHHDDYFATVLRNAEGLNVDLQPNISREKLFELYEQAAIYVHATGVNEDLERFPDRAEHFGISTLEAMAFGCVPVVIRAGGQPEIVQEGQNGFLFSDLGELKKMIAYVVEMFAREPDAYRSLSANSRGRASEFSRARAQEQFLELIARATHTGEDAILLPKRS